MYYWKAFFSRIFTQAFQKLFKGFCKQRCDNKGYKLLDKHFKAKF